MINPRSIATLGIGYSPYAIASLGIFFDGSIILRPSKPFSKPILVSNINHLQPTGFIFETSIIPNIAFNCVHIEIPSITSMGAIFSAPMVDYALPSYKIETSSIIIRFIVDEDLINFNEINNWLNDASAPDIEDRAFIDVYRSLMSGNSNGIIADGNLTILTNNNNPNIQIELHDIFPISVRDVVINSFDPNIRTCDVEMSVSMIKITQSNT